jgi:hypothetical protein
VGGPENPLLDGADLSTMIGPGTGSASFDDMGNAKYKNRRTVSIRFLTFYTLFITALPNYGKFLYIKIILSDEQF